MTDPAYTYLLCALAVAILGWLAWWNWRQDREDSDVARLISVLREEMADPWWEEAHAHEWEDR